MKKLMLALVAVSMIGMFASTAEAGRWRWRRSYYPPVVVRPYVAPVYVSRPVVVAPRPVYVAPSPVIYRQYYSPTSVYVRSGYYGGGVRVNTPGFGLHISY